MSVIPAKEKLQLYQGSTLDETFTFYTDDTETTPEDFTGWHAAAKVRAAFASAALLALDDAHAPSPSQSGIALGGAAGTARLYVTDEDMAALQAAAFTPELDDAGAVVGYTGVWDLEMTNPAGESFRYVMGPVTFSLAVTNP